MKFSPKHVILYSQIRRLAEKSCRNKMTQTNAQDPNYDWAQEHMVDFERYLTEQCKPNFQSVSAEDSSKFMAPMWWSVGYVIQRCLIDNKPVNPADADTLIDRAMLLLMLLTHSKNPIFFQLQDQFVLPMAKALKVSTDNKAINEKIYEGIVFTVHSLQNGKTLTVPDLTRSGHTTLEIGDTN